MSALCCANSSIALRAMVLVDESVPASSIVSAGLVPVSFLTSLAVHLGIPVGSSASGWVIDFP